MRILTSLAAIVLGASLSFAQYTATAVGTVLNYAVHQSEPEQTNKVLTMTLQEASTEGDLTTFRYLNHTDIPGSLRTEPDTYSSATCNPSDASVPTVWTLLTPADFKEVMIAQIQEEVASAGRMLTDEQLNQIRNSVNPSGKVILTLDPDAAVDAKIPNSSLRLNMEMMSISIHISNGKVLGVESVEVPAGTFENCLKVSYVMKQNFGPENIRHYITEWYAPGVGLVKEIVADKKGKELESQELTSIALPE